MIIRNLDDVQKTAVDMEDVHGITKQLVLGAADGVPHFSFRVFTLEPGGHSPYHSHEVEHLNVVLAGQGAIVDEESKMHPIDTGEFAFIAPRDKHQFRNTGREPFVFLCAVPKEYE